jgi:hypothetical protein
MEFDKNGSGMINFEEFKHFMRRLFRVLINKEKKDAAGGAGLKESA